MEARSKLKQDPVSFTPCVVCCICDSLFLKKIAPKFARLPGQVRSGRGRCVAVWQASVLNNGWSGAEWMSSAAVIR